MAKVKVARGRDVLEIDSEKLSEAADLGYEPVSAEEAKRAADVREAATISGGAQGLGEGVARGVTLGLSDVGLRALGADMGGVAARSEGLGSKGAELAGAVGTALLTGGGSAAGTAARTAARFTPAGLAARAGTAVERSVAGSALGGRVLGSAAQGATEGFLAGVGAEASALALGDKDLAGERLMAGGFQGLGVGALLGGGLGAAGVGVERAAAGASALGGRALEGLGKAAGRADETLADIGPQGGLLERGARVAGRVLGSGDPEAFARSASRLRTAEGRARILGDIDEAREASAFKIKGAADEVNAALDDAIRLTQGKGKLREIERRMEGVDNAIAPRHALAHIDEQQAMIRGLLDEAGDTISPEMRADLRKAMRQTERAKDAAIKGRTGAEAFQAVDDLKRELDVIARKRRDHAKRVGSPEVDDAATAVENLVNASRRHLEIEEIYGGGARLQKDMNAALSGELRAVEKLGARNSKLRTLFKRGEVADTDSALAIARLHGSVRGASKTSAVDDVLDARLHLLRTARNNYDLPPEAIKRFDDAERSIEGMRAQLRDQAETAAALDDAWKLREAEGNRSPSITAASTLGPSVGGLLGLGLGGPLGAALGTVAGYATRPYTLLRGAVGVLNQLDGLAKWKGGVDGAAAREATIAAGFDRLAEGGRSTVRAAARAAQRGAAGAGRRAGREREPENRSQRTARILATRAAVMAAASDPLELATQMEESVAELHDLAPEVARGIVERSAVAVTFLASKVPDVYEPAFGNGKPIVAPEEIDRFQRYVDAVQDPLGAVEKVMTGSLSLEHAEALRVVYPKIYAEMQSKALEMLGRRKQEGRRISDESLVQLGLMLDMPLTDSLKPGFLASLQGPAMTTPGPGSAPATPRAPKPIEVTARRTDLGRLEAGELRS